MQPDKRQLCKIKHYSLFTIFIHNIYSRLKTYKQLNYHNLQSNHFLIIVTGNLIIN